MRLDARARAPARALSSRARSSVNPVCLAIEELVLPKISHKCLRLSASLSIRTFIVALCLVLAIAIPSFARIEAFLGALTSFAVSLIFPTACAIRLLPLGPVEKAVNYALLVLGTIAAAVGTVGAVIAPAP